MKNAETQINLWIESRSQSQNRQIEQSPRQESAIEYLEDKSEGDDIGILSQTILNNLQKIKIEPLNQNITTPHL